MSTQNEAIERAATNGHLDVMKWLHEQSNLVQDLSDGFNHYAKVLERLRAPVTTFEVNINNTFRTFEGKLTEEKLTEEINYFKFTLTEPLKLGVNDQTEIWTADMFGYLDRVDGWYTKNAIHYESVFGDILGKPLNPEIFDALRQDN